MANDGRPQREAQKPSASLSGSERAANPVRFYEFDEFSLDAQRHLLRRNGEPVAIKPKALDTLLLLVQHRGRLLTKEELMDRLWPDTAVEEANLSQNVFIARKALGESPGEQRFIATVARQGYRFVGEVREIAAAESEAAADAVADLKVGAPVPALPGAGRRRRGRWLLYGLAGLLAAAVAAAGVYLWRGRAAGNAAVTVRSLAVLPFRNTSGDAQDDFFADGVTEAITTDLASISALRVISRQSAARFRGSQVPVAEISRVLGVDALLGGAVARSGGRIRVTVQLVHGASDRHLWAETYDRDLGDVLALQGQVARAVAHAIRVRVTDAERADLDLRRPVDPEAYALYLRGKHFLNLRSDNALRTSVERYQQAVARDPTLAAAHGELAIAYLLLAQTMPEEENERLVRAAATAALALDPRQADARTAMAVTGGTRDAAAILTAMEAVAKDNPNHALAQGWYGTTLIEACRHTEGLAQRRLTVQLEPLSTIAHLALGLQLARRGRYDEARASFARSLELDPDYADAHGMLGWTFLREGRHAEAVAAAETGARVSGDNPRMLARLAHVYGQVDRTADARRLLRTLEERARTESISPIYFAHVHAGLGDLDRAFASLDEAKAQGRFLRLNGDPLWRPLYTDPRFAALGRAFNETAPCPDEG